MNAVTGVGTGLAMLGVATAVWGGGGLAMGLASGGLAGINKPNDGYDDVKAPLKLFGAGLGVMAVAGTAAGLLGARTNNPAATAAAGVALIGGFAMFLGGVGIGSELAN